MSRKRPKARPQRLGAAGSARPSRWRAPVTLAALGGVAVLVLLVLGSQRGWLGGRPSFPGWGVAEPPAAEREATFAGRQACAACHPREAERWQHSHHDLAMQVADTSTVLGDFADATLTHAGVTSSFFRRDGKFLVRTEGPDAALHDYEIAYTFGVTPLQQYLVAFPGGRYQALGLAWDTRPRAAGGQRWFHLYPDARLRPGDPLHWTGLDQTWNYQCAECHSTNLQKNYRPEQDRYETTWAEIDVACEACHGPGSRHVAWARAGGSGAGSEVGGARGLTVSLRGRDGAAWVMDPETGTARRSRPLASGLEVEACARCHARRGVIHDPYEHGRPLMDTHRPALLEAGLYHADGQIRDEVYVYGSFLQSRMYRAGVTCSDCHDPHSLRLAAPGNAVCTRCHLAERFDTAAHHFHEPDAAGAQCVACHMPARTFMVVDPRRDHSLRVPRPDLSVTLGTPNACTDCHADRSARWAAEAVARWYGPAPRPSHYGEALDAGRAGRPGAETALLRLAADPAAPGIARATAVSLLDRYPGPGSLATVERVLTDPEPLVRMAALSAVEAREPRTRLRLAAPLLADPVRAVRIEAGRVLAAVPAPGLSPDQRVDLERAVAEYRHAQEVNADRPEAHLNLGILHDRQGRLDEAERAYRVALRLDPTFVAGSVNLADHYRRRQQDGEGERVLREGLARRPREAGLHHALGLTLVRQGRGPEALAALAQAAALAPDEARYGYVYGVALHSDGQSERALTVLRHAHEQHPGDRELLWALATISRDRGLRDQAAAYARTLAALVPGDPAVRRLVEQLAGRRP